jgi:POT family proton-dependent oligopeptide transporter
VAVLIGFEKITNLILGLAALVCLGYISYRAATLHDKAQAGKLIAFVILFLFHMIFWALYEQAGGSINLLTDRYVNRHGMDASQYQAVPAMFIVLMAPFFSFFWVKLRKLKMEPYTSVKFFWGLIFMAAGYLVLMAGIRYSLASGQMIPLIFLIGMYFFHITGELSISPIGLSIVTKLSPPGITGFVMGAWFLSIALGHKIAGFLGQRIASPEMETGTTGALKAFAGVYFTWGVVVMLGSAAILIFLTPWLRRWMSGIH